jgi:hypothetical protein
MPAKKGQKYNTQPGIKPKKVLDKIVNDSKSMSTAVKEVYGSKYNQTELTKTKGWQQLVKSRLGDAMLLDKHTELLNSSKMDHMVFPLGPEGEDDINFSGGKIQKEDSDDEDELDEDGPMKQYVERTTLTDKEIIDMLAEVNCTVRRIVHGNTARHVYFWSADNTARDKALDKAYKIKGYYPKEGPNTAIQVNIGDKMNQIRDTYGA